MERQTLSPAAPLTRLAELEQRLCSMIEIGKAMSSEHQVDRLLAVILDNAQLVASADAASIYVVSARDSLNGPLNCASNSLATTRSSSIGVR